MSAPRGIPPVWSPLTFAGLLAGAAAALREAGAAQRVKALLQRDLEPRDVLLTGSGTAALTLAIAHAAARRRGRPVALPAYGCFDLASAAVGADVPVVLYDVDPGTLAPDPASLARALAQEPCAAVWVHLFGMPVDAPRLRAAAEEAGAVSIEDAAQAHGATVRGQRAGGSGTLSVLSFGRGKGLTGGGGGALLAYDAAGEAMLRGDRAHMRPTPAGWEAVAGAAAQWLLGRPGLYALPSALPFLGLGTTRYHPPSPPDPMSRAAAAIIATEWQRAQAEAAVRRRNAARLAEALRSAGLTVPSPAFPAQPGWLRLPVLCEWSEGVRTVRLAAGRPLGILPGYPIPLCDLPPLARLLVNGRDDFAGARTLAQTLVTLPTHGMLRERGLRALERWAAAAGSLAAPPVLAIAG